MFTLFELIKKGFFYGPFVQSSQTYERGYREAKKIIKTEPHRAGYHRTVAWNDLDPTPFTDGWIDACTHFIERN